jgi:hypothetical protein
MMPMDTTPVREGPDVQKIELQDIDVTEQRDTQIGNKDTYFDNYEVHKVSLPEGKLKPCLK